MCIKRRGKQCTLNACTVCSFQHKISKVCLYMKIKVTSIFSIWFFNYRKNLKSLESKTQNKNKKPLSKYLDVKGFWNTRMGPLLWILGISLYIILSSCDRPLPSFFPTQENNILRNHDINFVWILWGTRRTSLLSIFFYSSISWWKS